MSLVGVLLVAWGVWQYLQGIVAVEKQCLSKYVGEKESEVLEGFKSMHFKVVLVADGRYLVSNPGGGPDAAACLVTVANGVVNALQVSK